MATLETKDFDTIVEEQAAIVQGSSSRVFIDFSVGSILRAVVEAYAAVAMWLQGLILTVLSLTRASTSSGTDLDTWMADFGLTRLPAIPATGLATFSRASPSIAATVPVGAIIQTADGAESFTVVADTGNPAYSSSAAGYLLAIGTASVTVPIVATTPGAAGNALAGAVNSLGQAIVGIDAVVNTAALANGADAETDDAFRARFIAFIASLSKATRDAVAFAISSTAPGLAYEIVENETRDGTPTPGFFYVTIDDGTGSPTSATIANVQAAIDVVRPLCSEFAVYAPITNGVSIAMTLGVSASRATAVADVTAALAAYVDSLPIGASLVWSQIIAVAYAASALVTNVTGVTINGAANDIPGASGTVIRASSITVV